MVEKQYISAQELLLDSFQLGVEIIKSGFHPNFIVGIWRGGTPVGIAVQELLDYFGIKSDHIAIRTSAYEGIGKQRKKIRVHGLEYIVESINAEDRLLIVDDVFDTGLSIQAVINALTSRCRKNTPNDLRIATPFFKPANNLTKIVPQFFLHKTDKWLVFPHELDGLTLKEVMKNKKGLKELIEKDPGLWK